MAATRIRVLVRGRVQGVGYRQSCADQARRYGVAGWVRNRSDGTVEAVFEGDAAAVAAMVAWCREGPRWAGVEDVETTVETVESLTGFRVAAGG
ncbi:MAG TPA: acylphosphatase [Acidimicrobiales bacterium]|jgi:acylphosphatase|nr:acylphosphatase [Acidimicrobiales bacterium]